MGRWQNAVSLRNFMLNQWDNDDYVQDWYEFATTKHSKTWSVEPESMHIAQAHMLAKAPVYFVEDQALDVVAVATQSFQPEPLLATDFITPSGFMLLPRPLYAYPDPINGTDYTDEEDNDFEVTFAPREYGRGRGPFVITWHPAKVISKEEGASTQEGHWNWQILLKEDADRPGDGVVFSGYLRSDHGLYVLGICTVIPFEADFWIREHTDTSNFMKPMQVILRLMQQKVFVTTSQAGGSKKKSKRAAKKELVRLVSLPRRVAVNGSDREGKKIEYDHRWWVNGHWRNQYYPSTNAHRQKWIMGFVKGPKDMPFIPKQRVYKIDDD